MLLTIAHQGLQPRGRVVSTSRSSRRRPPSCVIPFDEIQVVGRAYRDIGEYERAYLVWRATTEASYLEDARVGEVLRQRGKTLDGDRLPARPLARVSRHGVDRERLLRPRAGRRRPRRAGHDRPGAPPRAGRRRGHPVRAAPAGDPADQVVPRRSRPGTRWPTRRAWPWSATSSSWRTSTSVVKLAAPVRRALPQEHVPRQLPVQRGPRASSTSASTTGPSRSPRRSPTATYKDADGVDQPSPNKWQALYILGQIYDARRQPAKAARRTTSRSPTASPTPPARSRRSRART